MNNIGDRIIEIRKSKNLSQEEFGQVIGLSRSQIGCYEKNLRNVSDRAIRDICLHFNINENWLKTGTGDKYEIPNEINELSKLLADISALNDPRLNSIIKKLSELDEKYLDLIENLIDALNEKKEQ